MPQTVAFTLFAPLAAMGDVAVGERRAGFDRPGRSAVLGLVAAALGLDRADEAAHAELDSTYLLALRVLARGDLVQDYHTVQAPPADRKARWTTRRAALDRPSHRLETLLSLRDYRAAPVVDAALVARPDADLRFSPERIAEALRRPIFTLFFGRKSCPLGLPPGPAVSEAGSLGQVFRDVDSSRPEPAQIVLEALRVRSSEAPVFADMELAENRRHGLDMLHPDYRVLRIERRRDRPMNRRRWQFELRDEAVLSPTGGSA